MAGRVMRVVPKRHVVLSTSAAQGSLQEVFLAEHIDISQWRENVLFVRLHQPSTFTPAAGGFSASQPAIVVYYDGITAEDTNWNNFLKSAQTTALSTTGVSATSNMTVIVLPAGLGGMISISITCQTVAAVVMDCWISIDLSGKE